VQRLFKELAAWAEADGDRSSRTVRDPLGIETVIPIRVSEIAERLRILEGGIEEDPDLKSEVAQSRRQGLELRASLLAFLNRELEGHVYWVERTGRRRVSMNSAPVDVAPLLKPMLFDALPCVILTSATMAVNGSLDYVLGRLGADPCESLQVGSPFDFARQMRLDVEADMPEPTAGEIFHSAAAARILRSVIRSGGGAFVLFTSASMMRDLAKRLREPLEAHGLRLLVQGEGLPRHAMLEAFRREDGQVLLGLDSFWMGVDVRGDALRNVLIVRLPFSVPDHPLTEARMEQIRARGGDAFREYSLPEAVIKFRQGVGRLIRTNTDQGVVTVLDPRILSKWYGRWFIRALPEDVPVSICREEQPIEEAPPPDA
ncbi:MAG: helicase C-terminal domain-containing protein, partial [Kiritimatiellia bacterium]|nr:helicase C-terminal domain-containing protein [Kiritimatiellia bacterium]